MRLRDYVTHAPNREGRIPLLPLRGTEATTRWLVPEGHGWYTYCQADRLDIFSIPDTVHAACLPHHLRDYDPLTYLLEDGPAAVAAKKQALYRAATTVAETRLAAWLAAGQFATAWDDDDTGLDTALDTLTHRPYTISIL